MASDRAECLASGAEANYWDGLLEKELRLQHCASCGNWHWPAVWRCSACGGWDHAWTQVMPEGRIYSWTRTWHSFGGLEDFGSPFVPVVVELNGGGCARLLGILDDCDEPRIGLEVSGTFETVRFGGEEYPTIRWRP